jgi:hypothetical protein
MFFVSNIVPILSCGIVKLVPLKRRRDTQHNDMQHKGPFCDTWLNMTLSISNTQLNNSLPLYWVLLCLVSRFINCYAECHYAEYHYVECHYALCHNAECHYAGCRHAECRGVFETVCHFHPSLIFDSNAGAYSRWAPYWTPL